MSKRGREGKKKDGEEGNEGKREGEGRKEGEGREAVKGDEERGGYGKIELQRWEENKRKKGRREGR